MLRSALETAYKVFYNHYVRLDKSNKGAGMMATIHISLLIFLLILNIIISISMLANIKLIPSSKPMIWLFAAAYLLLAYHFLSRMLKLDKPLNGIFIEINVSSERRVWGIYGVLLLLVFSLALCKKFFY